MENHLNVTGVLETAINVADLSTAIEFYQRLFGFEILEQDERPCALNVGGRSILLLFKKGVSRTSTVTPGGTIPHHDGDCPTHFAFSVPAHDLPGWENRLTCEGVAIESRVSWPRGGRSVYFRDLDSNLVELTTPGLWAIY